MSSLATEWIEDSLDIQSLFQEIYSFNLELLFQEKPKNSCVLDRLSLQRLFKINEQEARKAQRKALRRTYEELVGIKELFPRDKEDWESHFRISFNIRELFPRYFNNAYDLKDFALKRLFYQNPSRRLRIYDELAGIKELFPRDKEDWESHFRSSFNMQTLISAKPDWMRRKLAEKHPKAVQKQHTTRYFGIRKL